MQDSTEDLKPLLEELISREIYRLATDSEVYAAAVYDPGAPLAQPKHFECLHRAQYGAMDSIRVHFDFEGIGVWYAIRKDGPEFEMRHILLEIENGRCVHSRAETIRGVWRDWSDIVSADPWVAERRDRYHPRENLRLVRVA